MRGSRSRRSAAPFLLLRRKEMQMVNAYYDHETKTFVRLERRDGQWIRTPGFSTRAAAINGKEAE